MELTLFTRSAPSRHGPRACGEPRRLSSGRRPSNPALQVAALVAIGCATLASPVAGQWIPTRYLGVRDGLAQSQVTAIAHDSHGYLWVATQGGVSRGDGRRFVTMTTDDGLPDDVITALAPADRGRMFLGTDSGALAEWTGEGFVCFRGPWQGAISGLARLPGEELLVGAGDGLWLWSPHRAERLDDGPVRAIAAAPGEVAADDPWTWPLVLSVRPLRSDGRRTVTVAASLQQALLFGEQVQATALDLDEIWLGTDRGGLLRIERSGTIERQADALAAIHALLPARNGGVWVGSGNGLWRVSPDGGTVQQPLVATEPGLEIRTLAEDRDGSVWASPWSGGLYVLDPEGFVVFNRSSGFPATQVWGFLEDRDGCVWMATEDVGALRWCGDRIAEHLLPGRELPPGRTIALAQDPSGTLWVATGSGVVRRDPRGGLRHLTTRHGLPDDYVRALAVDPSGAVWAATRGGLARLQGEHIRSWTLADGLPDGNLRGLAFDRRGRLWIATHGAGVVRFDGETFETFGPDRGLPHSRVWCVTVDSRDQPWAGTDGGLWRHRGHDADDDLVITEGLPSRNVLFVVEGADGGMWAGTTRGLAQVGPDGRVLRTLSAVDGLVGSEASTNAALLDRRGRLWAGLAEGVTRVDPLLLHREPRPPAVAVERVLVGGEPVSGTLPLYAPDLPAPSPLVIGPNPSDLRLELAAPVFSSPERVRFRFWLEGYEHGPGRPTDEHSVTYRRLPPGSYRFHLEAAVADGRWSAPLTVPLRVRPSWYQATAFRAASIGLLVAAVAAVFAARSAAERRRRRRLEREVRQRTGELAAANRRIRDQNRRLAELSRTDPLTGLANRRAVEEQLPLELAVLRREIGRSGALVAPDYHGCAVFLLDLDHFKAVNDRWGHETGDAVLRATAASLRSVLREVDLVVRWGGEEILVLARSLDRAGVEALASKLLVCIATTRVELPTGGELQVTATAGFVQYPLAAGDPLEPGSWAALVDAADRLLYLGKERGRARACGACRRGAGAPVGHDELLRDLVESPDPPPRGVDLVTVTGPRPLPSSTRPRTVPGPTADS